jgi:hypothetical protein
MPKKYKSYKLVKNLKLRKTIKKKRGNKRALIFDASKIHPASINI